MRSPTTSKITLGMSISHIRKNFEHMSQKNFALEAGISRNYLSLIERDQAPGMSVKILLQICEAFQLDRHVLLNLYYRTYWRLK